MAGGVVLAAAVLAAAWSRHASDVQDAAGAGRPSLEAATANERTPASTGLPSSKPVEPRAMPTGTQPRPAWQTMAEARVHGDERAPPIERPLPESQAPAPTAWELSDPVRYREYELRGQRRLRAEYLMAVEEELPKWKALLAQARSTGAPPAAIAEAEEKIRRLEARLMALRRTD